MGTFLERFRNQLTAAAAALAGVIGVHQRHVSPGTCSLGDTEALGIVPTSIKNGRVQASFRTGPVGQIGTFLFRVRLGFGCLAHLRDLQVFKNQGSKVVHQRMRGLMVEVFPLVAYPAMGFGQGNRRAFAPMRATLLVILGRLQELDPLQPAAVVTWVLNGFPSRERGKMEESQVKTYRLFAGRQGFFFHLTREGDVPVVHVALDGDRFHLAHQRAVQSHQHVSDFGKGQHRVPVVPWPTRVSRQSKARLGVRERVVAALSPPTVDSLASRRS